MHSPSLEFTAAPYPGLRPFRADEVDIFFGRERQTDALLAKLAEHRFLAVLGPSGCGKSSLVRAGMLPALETGFMTRAGSSWRVTCFRPGQRPLRSLADALLDAKLLDGERAAQRDAPVFLEASLRRGPLGLIDIVRTSTLEPGENLLVLVDQFEELFRFSSHDNAEEADAFISLLIESAAAQHERIYVAITMRSDFLSECAAFHGLPEMINKGLYLTPKLTRTECSACITNPARVFGAAVEPSLVNRLLNDFGPDPDQLPLLQHALLQMWKRRTYNAPSSNKIVIDAADYDAVGGIAQSLSGHAEGTLAELAPRERKIAEIMFRCLADARSERRDRRTPTKISEIAAWGEVGVIDVIRVADAFRKRGRSFLTPPEEVLLTPDTVLDISHESLLRQWPTLATWIREESDSAAFYRRVKDAAQEWRRGEVDLWASPMLERALAWRAKLNPTAAWATRYGTRDEFVATCEFLDASRKAHDLRRTEQLHARRRKVAIAFASIAVAVAAITTVVYHVLYVWEYTAEYRSYVRVFGEPRGIGRLRRDELQHRAASYRIVTAGRIGHVKRMYAVNGHGKLRGVAPDYDASESRGLLTSTWHYEYGSDGRVSAEMQYSRTSEPVQARIYISKEGDNAGTRSTYFIGPKGTPIMVSGHDEYSGWFWIETTKYTSDGYEGEVTYRGRQGEPVRGRDRAYGQRREYDRDGHVTTLTSLDIEGRPMNDAFGNAILRTTRDERGNQIEAAARDAGDRPTMVRLGWTFEQVASDAYGYEQEVSYLDEKRRPVATTRGWHKAIRTFTDRGELAREHYLDAGEHPTVGLPTQGSEVRCYGFAFEYDDGSRLRKQTCLDEAHRPTPTPAGWVSLAWGHDERDRVNDESYLDAAGNLTLNSSGYASASYRLDTRGRVEEVAYLGIDGHRVVTTSGYAGRRTQYDDQRHQETETYLGLNLEPVAGESGYAIQKRSLDPLGHTIEVQYLDAREKPMTTKNGFAGLRHSYDESGQAVEHQYLGIDGDVIFGNDGYAGWRSEFDGLGRETKVTYLGLRREPIASRNSGVVAWQSAFDEQGREIRRIYLGYDGRPTVFSQGETGWVATYDNVGNQTEITYVDKNADPTLHSWDEDKRFAGSGHARRVRQYSASGDVLDERYYDVHLQPTRTPQGWSHAVHKYDQRGNRTLISYFDEGDKPVKLRHSGYHAAECTHDPYGRVSGCSYYDVDGQTRVLTSRHYARFVNKYDAHGELADQRLYDLQGNPAADEHGVSRTATTRDEHGWTIRRETYGPGGDRDRLELVEYVYDRSGRLLDEIQRDPGDAKGGLIRSPSKCAIVANQWHDDYLHEQTCLDADRKPMVGANLAAKVVWVWEIPRQQVLIRYYDENNRPFSREFGDAGVRYRYDGFDRIIEMAFLNPQGRLVNSGGFARMTKAYSPQSGDLLEEAYFEATGVGARPVSRMKAVLNGLHQMIEEQYFDASDAPASLSDTGQHVTRYAYDAYGNVSELTYLDARRRPTRGFARHFANPPWQLCGRWVLRHDTDGKLIGSGTCERQIPAAAKK
jgi:YD repeat-containing protein